MNEFTKMVDNLIKARKSLPNKIAVVAVKFSKDRFRDQAWLDSSREPWQPRKSPRSGGRKKSQTLLVNSGRLKRSIRKIKADQTEVVVGTDVPYAKIHNDGGTITKTARVKSFTRKGRKQGTHVVKAHSRRMNTTIPKRQFLGNSAALASDIEKLIVNELENAMKI